MITVVFGALGGGKTLFAVDQIERARAVGLRVLTNIRTRVPGVEELRDVVRLDSGGSVVGGFWERSDIDGCLIVIDEADFFFDAFDWAKFGKGFLVFLKSIRKRGIELILITQSFENLHVRIRRLAQRFILCDNTARSNWLIRDGWLPRAWARFFRVEFSSERFIESNIVQTRFLTPREATRLFKLYDTKQAVGS